MNFQKATPQKGSFGVFGKIFLIFLLMLLDKLPLSCLGDSSCFAIHT